MSRSSGTWQALLALLVVFAALLATPVRGRPASAAGTLRHGVINALLRAQVRDAVRQHSGIRERRSELVPLVVTSSRDVAAAVRRLGGVVQADIKGRVLAASLPASAIASLASVPGVDTLYPSLRYHLDLDRSVPEIRANIAWTERDHAGLPEQGQGVIVGTVDTGIDYRNPDFINPDGSTRILGIWDQTASGGTPPAGYTFGDYCDRTSIQTGTCAERDTDGHGTHVAGIVAGNGRSGGSPPEIGVAPQANLLVVKSDLTLDHVIAAWKFLIDTAQSLGRPIVINNSFGSSISPHDGSSPDSEAISTLSGEGSIFVAAAGNEGDGALHTSGSIDSSTPADITLTGTGRSDKVAFGVFYPRTAKLAFTLTKADSGESFSLAEGGTIENRTTSDGADKVTMESDAWNAHWSILYVKVTALSGKMQDVYRLHMTPVSVSGGIRYDAWVEEDGTARFSSPDDSDTVGSPADGRSVIAVGNYVTRAQWTDQAGASLSVCSYFPCRGGQLEEGDIAAYSSTGPTRDGRQKPDISAPGTMIISSLSRDIQLCSATLQDDCRSPKEVSQDGLHLVDTGTSMSSPHVAGTVALMLQANPTLDFSHVLSIVQSTARHDDFTGEGWSPAFGAGKVDADAAVRAALQLPFLTPVPRPPTSTPRPSPTATSTPLPTSTPVPPVSLSIVSVRVDRHGTSNGWHYSNPPPTTRVGAGLDLSVYTRLQHLASNDILRIDWNLSRNSVPVLSRSRQVSRSIFDNGVTWDVIRYVPRKAGTYTLQVVASMGQLSDSRSIKFHVIR